MDRIDFKQLAYDLKDLDESKGVVTAYANVYNVKDSDGDISAYGSFEKTVKENFKRIRVLKDHNPTMMIGVPLAIDTKDNYGLLTTTQFNMKKDLGKDMFTDVKLMYDSGLNAELSIGYKVMARDAKNKSIITEYKLGEYSFLSSWAANQFSTVQDIKSIKNHYGFMELLQKAYNLDYSDGRLRQIEILLKSMDNMDANTDRNIDKNIEFIDLMIPHHQAAIDMVNKHKSMMTNEKLISLANNIEIAQAKEIDIMQNIKSLIEKPSKFDTSFYEPIILDTLKEFKNTLKI